MLPATYKFLFGYTSLVFVKYLLYLFDLAVVLLYLLAHVPQAQAGCVTTMSRGVRHARTVTVIDDLFDAIQAAVCADWTTQQVLLGSIAHPLGLGRAEGILAAADEDVGGDRLLALLAAVKALVRVALGGVGVLDVAIS